jgi:hypothetical protein
VVWLFDLIRFKVVYDSTGTYYVPIVRRMFLGRKRNGGSKKRDGSSFAETATLSLDVKKQKEKNLSLMVVPSLFR